MGTVRQLGPRGPRRPGNGSSRRGPGTATLSEGRTGPSKQRGWNCCHQAPKARCWDRSHCDTAAQMSQRVWQLPDRDPLALPLPTRVREQHGGSEARRGSSDEVQKEELTSLGFQNKNSNLGSEKIKKGKELNLNQWTEKYGLLTPPICIQFYMRKKNTPIHHNVVQMFATKDL